MENFIPFMLIGIVVATGLFGVVSWLRKNNVKVNWYEWLISGVGFALLLLAIQHFFGAISELFFFAAWMGLAIVGIPALILLAIAWQLVIRRIKKA
ncbi:dehalogenase [Dehalococcoides sp.]|uniref:dehalogenase n=1 Tax=Dehalococcoides sp. TaxID=1966486 RepID=UPI002ACB1308|nr:dehalogenase [Dehalococcoides sp.]